MIKEMLQGVGVTKDNTILLHSDMTFYATESRSSTYTHACENALNEFMDCVQTLVVPTFNYDFSTKGKPYSHEKTFSQVGWFTNYVLLRNWSRRSFHPVFSFVVLGKNQRELTENVSKDAFGENSVFDRLYQANAKIVMLSVPATFMTFCHYVEQRLNVWYRYKKYFTGQVTKDGETWIDTFSLYVRDLERDVHTNLGWLVDKWEKGGIIKRYEINPQLYMLSISCQDLFNALRCELVQNLSAIITYKED